MENKHDWNLKEIFETENEFEQNVNELYKYLDEMKKSKGKLNDSVDEIFKCYKNLEKALELHEKLYGYAMLKYHQDMNNQESIKLYKRLERITTEFSEAESFISPEVSKISDSRLEEYLTDCRMKEYEKTIRDIMKEKNIFLVKK